MGISLERGAVVCYGPHGVCRVTGTERMDLGCGKKDYYILEPVGDSNIRLYLPGDGDPERLHLRNVLRAEEIFALVEAEKTADRTWIADSKVRKELAAKALRGGDPAELIAMVRGLHSHAQSLPQGKTMPMSDLEQMRNAEKRLFNEFSFVLEITREQVLPFLLGEITAREK